MIYQRRQYEIKEKVKCETKEDALKMAVRDWSTGEWLPLNLKDDSGNEIMSHKELRKYLLEETKLPEFRKNWR